MEKMNDNQQGLTRPRMQRIKSPWGSALGTDSIKSAYQDVSGAMSPRCLHVVTSASEALKGGGDGGCTFKAIGCLTISPSVASLCKRYQNTLLCMQPKVLRGWNAQCNGHNPPTCGSVKMMDWKNRGSSSGSSSNPSVDMPKKPSILVRSTGLTRSENHLSSPTIVTTNSSALTFSPVTNPATRYRRVEFTPFRPKVWKNGNRSLGFEGVTGKLGRGDEKEQCRGLDAQRIKYVPEEGHGGGSGNKEYKGKHVVPNMYAYVSSGVNRCPLRLPSSFLFKVPNKPKPSAVMTQTSSVRALIDFFEYNHSCLST